MIFTAWGQDGIADTLIAGEGPPHFADGTVDTSSPERIWIIEADSWEESRCIYHRLQGWESP